MKSVWQLHEEALNAVIALRRHPDVGPRKDAQDMLGTAMVCIFCARRYIKGFVDENGVVTE